MDRWLVVGLGNPGQRYRKTRHNVGFATLDEVAARAQLTWRSLGRGSTTYEIASWDEDGREITLLKPLTYMNESGKVVAPMAKRHGIPPSQTIVAYDDLDLPLGQLRLGVFSSSGGHRGVESVIAALGSGDFLRVRVGVAPAGARSAPAEQFVLEPFSADESQAAQQATARAADAVQALLRQPLATAQNQFNTAAA